jgi:hypothetical protein
MIGLLIGIIAGGIQFWLLSKFVGCITGANGLSVTTVLYGILQFFMPLGVLVAIGFLRRSDLLPAALGIVGAIFAGVIIKNMIRVRKTRGRGDKNDD